jgi:hypothetical protein
MSRYVHVHITSGIGLCIDCIGFHWAFAYVHGSGQVMRRRRNESAGISPTASLDGGMGLAFIVIGDCGATASVHPSASLRTSVSSRSTLMHPRVVSSSASEEAATLWAADDHPGVKALRVGLNRVRCPMRELICAHSRRASTAPWLNSH